jgi:hypothetical protein
MSGAGNVFGPGIRAVLVVEGDGDAISLRLAAEVAGRTDLLEGIEIRPLVGTTNLQRAYVAHADATRAGIPILALFDSDEPGQKAFSELGKRGFSKRELIQYADVFEGSNQRQYPYEAEDLWDPSLMEMFGRWYDSDRQTFRNGHRHYDLNQDQKLLFHDFLLRAAGPSHTARWVQLMELIRERLDLDKDPPAQPTQAEPSGAETRPSRRSPGDAYDDRERWTYAQLWSLARERGHRFRGRPTRDRVIEVLRQQDGNGWKPGALEHSSRAAPRAVAASRPTSDPDLDRVRRDLRTYLTSKVCPACAKGGPPEHEACSRALRLAELKEEDRAELAEYLAERQCSVCRAADDPVHPACRIARRHAEQTLLL